MSAVERDSVSVEYEVNPEQSPDRGKDSLLIYGACFLSGFQGKRSHWFAEL